MASRASRAASPSAIRLAISAVSLLAVAAPGETLYWNAFGRVVDASGVPLADVEICIRAEGASGSAAPSARCVRSRDGGAFLVDSLPEIQAPFRLSAGGGPGDGAGRLDVAGIAPAAGASLSPAFRLVLPPAGAVRELDARDRSVVLESAERAAVLAALSPADAPHAAPPPAARGARGAAPSAAPLARLAGDLPFTYHVFATREGLVGFTTANGHVIVQNDRFVALPSRRGLNKTDALREFQVELSVGDRRVVVPVFDVGPWNTEDDYWNPASLRQRWSDLPQGLPQAQAAVDSAYNGGLDGIGRKVLNRAGIDLADGVFWEDLGLRDNSWIDVRFLWKLAGAPGRRVWARQPVNVRSAAGGTTVLRRQPCAAAGVVSGAPVGTALSGHWYLFWPVRWDDGLEGWSAENYLTADSLSVDCSDPGAGIVPEPLDFPRLEMLRRGVRIRLDDPAAVTVTLLAPDGREVARLADRRREPPGWVELDWPAALAHGVYILRISIEAAPADGRLLSSRDRMRSYPVFVR